jgi:hypothetical protein
MYAKDLKKELRIIGTLKDKFQNHFIMDLPE